MAKRKQQEIVPQKKGYHGKLARTGNSLGFRFDRALFQSHPEFSGEVRAHVIAPGTMIVMAEPAQEPDEEYDPVLAAFLNFLADDIEKHPEQLVELDQAYWDRIDKLVGDIPVDLDEDMSDERLLDGIF